MDPLLEIMKPQLEALQQMYKAGYEMGIVEGKRIAYLEMKKQLEETNV